MSQIGDQENRDCPICSRHCPQSRLGIRQGPGGTVPSNAESSDMGFLIRCPRCGTYALTDRDRIGFDGEPPEAHTHGVPHITPTQKRRLSALLREKQLQHSPYIWLQLRRDGYVPLTVNGITNTFEAVSVHYEELMSKWPTTVIERLSRGLANLCGRSSFPGEEIIITNDDCHLFFADNDSEAAYYLRTLAESGHVVNSETSSGSHVQVTAAGWARVQEQQRTRSPENPAFIAMWFSGDDEQPKQELDQYFEAVSAALLEVGYGVIRVDLVPHNDFIMDQVIAGIRQAPFVLADFTGHRPGVYFEAGYARGLNIPVIHTCKASHFDAAHFDIKQINTIQWGSPADIQEPLKSRILATIGRGPNA